jgi:hypothetical protein
MIPDGFHSEWVTLGEHRIFINVRGGFPGRAEREIAALAVDVCNRLSDRARVVEVFHDDTHTDVINVYVATDNPADKTRLRAALEDVFENGVTIVSPEDGAMFSIPRRGFYDAGAGNVIELPQMCSAEVEVYPRGNEQSDHYNRTRYLSECHFSRHSMMISKHTALTAKQAMRVYDESPHSRQHPGQKRPVVAPAIAYGMLSGACYDIWTWENVAAKPSHPALQVAKLPADWLSATKRAICIQLNIQADEYIAMREKKRSA